VEGLWKATLRFGLEDRDEVRMESDSSSEARITADPYTAGVRVRAQVPVAGSAVYKGDPASEIREIIKTEDAPPLRASQVGGRSDAECR
jgi:hypothetical protein